MHRAVLGLTILLLAPTCLAATEARLELDSAAPVHLDAHLGARLAGGSARIDESVVTTSFTILVVRGVVAIDSWGSTHVPRGHVPDPSVTREEIPVQNATLRFTLANELFAMNVLAAETGALVVAGTARSTGVQTRLPRDVGSHLAPPLPATVPSGGEYVPMRLARGDAFVGNYPDPDPLLGYPLSEPAVMSIEGDAKFHVHGGVVEFADATGAPRRYRLGNWTEEVAIGGVARREVWQRLIFEGELGGSDVPTGRWWIAGAPTIEWEIDGTARWRDATGRAVTPHGTTSFRDATVEATGIGTIRPHSLDLDAPLVERRYTAQGSWETILVEGAALPAPRTSPVLAGAAGVGIAALLALAAWLLYTRLARSALLTHPMRKKIHEAVSAEPGIHLRELHRRVGGAWGPFTFHLDMLARGGHVTIQREGTYKTAHPAGLGSARPSPPRSSTARAILEALPADGSPLPIADLRMRAGFSRQLVDHHLRALAAQGHVVVSGEGRARIVRRSRADHRT